MAYGKSNGHVIDDVKWPWKVKVMTPSGISRKRVPMSYHVMFRSSVCYKAVWSAILATAWLLVNKDSETESDQINQSLNLCVNWPHIQTNFSLQYTFSLCLSVILLRSVSCVFTIKIGLDWIGSSVSQP